MDPVVSVQNKNFTGNTKKLGKSSWSQIGHLNVIYTDNSLEFGRACEDLSWNHCMSTPHRSETHGIAERAVHRVKEGTSAILLQSGLNESWWADSMECYAYLRNVTDLLSDGKTPYERRFGQPFKGPIIPFGSLVEYHPITAKDQSRTHQFGKKVLLGLFLGYAAHAGWILKGDIKRLQTLRSWRRWTPRKSTQKDSMRKRWYFSNKRRIYFPIADGRIKTPGGDQDLRTSTSIRQRPIQRESHLDFLGESEGSLPPPHDLFPDAGEANMIFGPCQETSFSAITLNPESNFTRRERNHSLFHWNTLMYPKLLIRIWMSSKRNVSMIIGISMGQEACLIHGQASLNLLYRNKNLLTDICGPGGD